MPRYRNVLVAYDGSRGAELALAHAVAIAQVHRARMTIVAVAPAPPPVAWHAASGARGMREAEHQQLGEALRAAADSVPDDLSVATRLLDGDPARVLLQVARDDGFDLIVMGSRGRGQVTAALLGSVSTQLMQSADVPVIVIHQPSDGPDLAA